MTEIRATSAVVRAAYQKKLGQAAADQLLAGGYRVYGNFVDGLKGKNAFEPFQPTDPSELWQLYLPMKTQVTDTIFQLEWFRTSIGGHAQIRFKLSNPLLLVSQETGELKFIEGDVVYALMALRTETGNQSWNAVTGLTGSFAASYMLATTSHMAGRQLRSDDSSVVEQYRLNFTEAQKRNLFAYALQVGPRVGERDIYNLIYNSCINAALRAIRTIDSRVDAWEFNPYRVLPQLQSLGLVNETMPTLNDEFLSPVRTLAEPANEATLQMVEKLRGVMATKTFEESIRTLAATVIEDRWTTAELNAVLNGLKTGTPDLTVVTKTASSVQRLKSELANVLKRNQIELPELMAYLTQASLTSR